MINVIINADDFGINDSVNEAIVYCFNNGLISNTTIMTNMPGSQKAIDISRENNFFDCVGLHLNLREGYPLTEQIRSERIFCNKNGMFETKISKFKRYFTSSNTLDARTQESLTREIKAQMNWYRDAGFNEFHIDSHQSIHTWYVFLSALKPLLKEYNFKTVRKRVSSFNESLIKKKYKSFINRQITNPIQYLYDIKTFVDNSEKLIDGEYYEVMCHPILKNGIPIDSLSGIRIDRVQNIKNINVLSYNDINHSN